jgi:hypothetical protein
MQLPINQPPSPFLQKFNGKKQKINKDGLLEMLSPNKSPKKVINDA